MHSAGTQLSGLRNAIVAFWHNLEEYGAMDIEEKMGMTSGSDSEDENEENNPLKAICLHSKFCQLSSSGSPLMRQYTKGMRCTKPCAVSGAALPDFELGWRKPEDWYRHLFD